uniref:Uncharacterized protein n=1 Tax=Arundo donax TaxID=35708 RepID=A0A0A9AWJ0_ARUDO
MEDVGSLHNSQQQAETLWPIHFTLVPINMGSSCLYPSKLLSMAALMVPNPSTENAPLLAPADA